ncbi:MAG: NAD(P)-dependent oxidoreductase [Elainellaceae cyanobacterium]
MASIYSEPSNRNRAPAASKLPVVAMTGAGGMIGSFLYESLQDNYNFKCIDIKKPSWAKNFVKVNINNYKSVLKTFSDADVILHLASPRFGCPWKEFHSTGIEGTRNIFEAARVLGVKKIIYASSFHLLGWDHTSEVSQITPEMPVAPDSIYAASKAFGEALGYYYARQYGISVFCLRIGTFCHEPPPIKGSHDRILKTWCSPNDMARLISACIDAEEDLGFHIFYGVSNNKQRFWDISNAQKVLGYSPVDNAEDFRPIDN